MEWVVVAAIAALVLVCPAMMFGPMLLERLGVRKRASSHMACMGMSAIARPHDISTLRRRRAELDQEIAAAQTVADRATQQGAGSRLISAANDETK